jgi:hypothetical protein
MTAYVSGPSDHSGSAKIYTFPARGRFAASNQRQDAPLPRGVIASSGGAWYHEQAIQEAHDDVHDDAPLGRPS